MSRPRFTPRGIEAFAPPKGGGSTLWITSLGLVWGGLVVGTPCRAMLPTHHRRVTVCDVAARLSHHPCIVVNPRIYHAVGLISMPQSPSAKHTDTHSTSTPRQSTNHDDDGTDRGPGPEATMRSGSCRSPSCTCGATHTTHSHAPPCHAKSVTRPTHISDHNHAVLTASGSRDDGQHTHNHKQPTQHHDHDTRCQQQPQHNDTALSAPCWR